MNDLLSTIARVRRGTMNHDVITICDELERRLVVRALPAAEPAVTRPRFDKTAYQRELMRKRRAKAKV